MRTRTSLFRFGQVVALIGLLATGCVAPAGSAAISAPAVGALASSPLLRSVAEQSGAQEVRLPSIEPPTLDPGLAEDAASIDIINQLFEGLVAYDPTSTPYGAGAETWTVSPDGLTYTFTLRQGMTWSDGVPVTAGDYAYAWKRNVSPEVASPYAKSLFPVKNGAAINDGTMDPEQLGVQALDDHTLVVTLEEPASYFLSLASTWTLVPLRKDIVERYGDGWTEPGHIVTNGPYLLSEWTHDTRIVLTRNESYGGTSPTIQKATFRAFPEDGAEQMLASYEAGEIDTTGAGVPAELPTSQKDRIQSDPLLSRELTSFRQSGTRMLIVNNRKPYLQDVRVREALGMALDRAQILGPVLKLDSEPAYTLQPAGIIGRNPDAWPKDNVAGAQQLLADAGYPGGAGFPTITLTYNTSDVGRLFAQYAQQRWKDTLGIDVRIESMELKSYLDWRHGTDWEQRGDLYWTSWFSDYEDPNNWYNQLWDSRADPESFNGGWKNAQFDALVRQGAGEIDASRRASLYGQAEALMAQDYPYIPLFHYSIGSLVKPYLQGYTPSRVLGLTPLRTMSVSR
jgi:oligopeptide transport system substrate-binding protein